MTTNRRLAPLVMVGLLFLVALFLAPDLDAGFRSEDFLDFDRYSRVSLGAALREPHLDSKMVTYWRPLGDGVTWALVNGLGPHPLPIRLVLVVLHALAALGVAAATRRLLGLSAGAALAAGLLALLHPFSAAVLTYVDGGVPALLASIGIFFGLAALGRWRDGERGILPLLGWTTFAMLAHDAAILVPIAFVLVAWLLPRSERRTPWLLLLLVPAALALRHFVVGRAFDGYGALTILLPDQRTLFPQRLLTCTLRLFVPAFDDLHEHARLARWTMLGVALAAAAVAVATRRASVATPLRQGLALLVLVVVLLGMGADLFLGGRDAIPDELVLAYRTHPAALAAMLFGGWLLGRTAGRRWWGSLALAAPALAILVLLREPVFSLHVQAQRWASGVAEAVARHAESSGARRLLVREVPVKTAWTRFPPPEAPRSVTRCLQYGLSSSVRPPFRSDRNEIRAYPLFRELHDGQLEWVSRATIDALTASPWLEPVRCIFDDVRTAGTPATPVSVVPIDRPTPAPAAPLRLFASPDGVESVLAPDLADATQRFVGADGSIELGVSGDAPGVLRVFLLNRVHPVAVLSPSREPGPREGVDVLRIRTPWLAEIAHRFPGDVSFVVLEAIPAPPSAGSPPSPLEAAAVSNVLPVRLREGL